MSKYRHFTDEESANVADEVMQMLDKARDLAGFPIIITSGYRTVEQELALGGKETSAHCKGLAVDMAAPQDPYLRQKLTWALGLAGFQRLEICNRHFHVDIQGPPDKPSPLCWEGPDR